MALAAEVGYAELTIEGIAARAGVGKQTIYRWWPSKADVLLEAGVAKADLHVPVTDPGPPRRPAAAFLESPLVHGGRCPRCCRRPPRADGGGAARPGFGERFRVSFLERRREAVGMITSRALDAATRPAKEAAVVADIVFGTIWSASWRRGRSTPGSSRTCSPCSPRTPGPGDGAGSGPGAGPR